MAISSTTSTMPSPSIAGRSRVSLRRMGFILSPLPLQPSPPALAGGEGGARAKRGRVRWAAAPAPETSRACQPPPHLPIASQWVPSSPPLRGGEDPDKMEVHIPSPALHQAGVEQAVHDVDHDVDGGIDGA